MLPNNYLIILKVYVNNAVNKIFKAVSASRAVVWASNEPIWLSLSLCFAAQLVEYWQRAVHD